MRTMIKLTKLMIFAFAAATVAGSAPAAAAVDMFLTFGAVKGPSVSGKIREAAARSAVGQQVEVMSWSWGASQRGWDGSVKGSTAAASNKPVPADYDGDGKTDINVAVGDLNGDGRADRSVKSPRDSASGLPTGKRAHQPVGLGVGPGSVTLVGKFPACTVGAAYDDATLQVTGARYTLTEVMITGCPATPGASGVEATQGISLNYTKIMLAK